MTMRYWVIGGDYEGPDFRALIPGTEKMVGPFECERKAMTEWTRLARCPAGGSATTRYSIASEAMRTEQPRYQS
jgi:hypothetical protein